MKKLFHERIETLAIAHRDGCALSVKAQVTAYFDRKLRVLVLDCTVMLAVPGGTWIADNVHSCREIETIPPTYNPMTDRTAALRRAFRLADDFYNRTADPATLAEIANPDEA